MFYPLLRSFRTDLEGPLLNLKAAFHMGVKDTEIGCIWVKWREHTFHKLISLLFLLWLLLSCALHALLLLLLALPLEDSHSQHADYYQQKDNDHFFEIQIGGKSFGCFYRRLSSELNFRFHLSRSCFLMLSLTFLLRYFFRSIETCSFWLFSNNVQSWR